MRVVAFVSRRRVYFYLLITVSGGVRGELRRQVLSAARRHIPLLSVSGDLDQLGAQVSPGGTRSATEALPTSADLRGDPQNRVRLT